jgi:flagellar hook assembly protein FlgD
MVQIRFNIPKEQNVEISILNILGETVRTLVNNKYSTGLNTIVWDGKNDYGHDLSTGVYLCRLKTKNYNESIKILLVK